MSEFVQVDEGYLPSTHSVRQSCTDQGGTTLWPHKHTYQSSSGSFDQGSDAIRFLYAPLFYGSDSLVFHHTSASTSHI